MAVTLPPATSGQRASRVAVGGAGAAVLIGGLSAAAKITGAPLIPVWPPGSSSIALWVAGALLLMAVGLLALLLIPEHPVVRPVVTVITAIVLAASLVTLLAQVTGSSFDIERLSPIRQLARVPLVGPRSTSPLGPPSMVCASVALLLLAVRRGRSMVGALALVPFVAGVLVCTGNLYRVPLFQSSSWEPISLAAGLGALLLSLALICAAGPETWPLRTLSGPSVRSQLFRWFMPFTVLVVVLTDLLTVRLFSGFSPALGSVINTVMSVAAAAIVTYYVARTIGGRLDRAEGDAARLNRLYAVVSQVNELLTRVEDAEALFREACRIVVESGGVASAWAGFVDPVTHWVRPVAQFGREATHLDALPVSVDDIPEGRGPAGVAVRERRPYICRNIATDPRMSLWRDKALAAGFASSAAFPLMTHGTITHVYLIYAREVNWFTAEQVTLLEGLAEDMSYALGALETKRQHADAEERLVESEHQFRSLIENSSDLITITDETGVIRYESPSVRTLLGFEPKERVGGNIRDLIHADDMDRVQQAIAHTLAPNGTTEPVTCRLRHKLGTWRLVESVAWNMLSIRGVAGVVIHSRDVTDRHKLEEQLRQAQKMETVGQLAGGIAHDFNNMLSVIMANTDLVTATLPAGSAETLEELRDVRGAAERGAAMVRQLMSFSRVGGLEVRPTDLGRLAKRVGTMLRRMLPANIAVEVPADPESQLVMADPGAVEQMVLNLATNARDAMPQGGQLGITIRRVEQTDLKTSDAGRADPSDYVCLAVADTGAGMDAGALQRLFEPFFTTKPLGKGTGLGMAMVHGLMNQHGGFVRVTSQPGQGTTVRLCFPVAAEGAAIQETKRTDVRVLRGNETVLVVEDEDAIRRAAQRILEKHGYQVLTAEDGDTALRLLAEPGRKVDLVFTDMMMPNSGGADLYHRVAREVGPRRFLVASGHSARDVREDQGLPAAVPFVRKPWTLEEMLEAVRKALDAPVP